jgi:nicotinamide-nucleotide amidase
MLRHDNTDINVIMIDEIKNRTMPKVLFKEQNKNATIQIFDEDLENVQILLEPLAQTHDINLLYIPIIPGWIKVHIQSKRYGNISQFINSTKQLMNNKIIAASNIVPYIIEKLYQNQKKITFAESCTGGLLSYYFTKENGASSVFDGGLVSYSNALKENWLGVSLKTLESFGAVSLEVVNEMSDGAINVTFSNYSIAVSGIAGPTGGTEDKPVGSVCISVRNEKNVENEAIQLQGDRNFIQEQSVLYALKMLVLLDKKTFM